MKSQETASLTEIEDYLRWIDKKGYIFLLASHDGCAIGWISLTRKKLSEESSALFIGMGVKESYRNKGVGKQLLDSLLNIAEEKGIESVYLEVFSANQVATQFYQSNSFKILKKKDGILLMKRKLTEKVVD